LPASDNVKETAAVLVIGDVMLDIIVAPERAIEHASDTPATIGRFPGGSGANQAAWLGHLGNKVYFAGRVGRDAGAEHASALRLHGVEPVFAIDDRARTGVLVTLVAPGGERSFMTDRGANAHLARADLPDALLDLVTLVHVSGYALFAPGPRAAVRDFLATARRRGVGISVDSGSTAFLREIGPPAFLESTKSATLLFANAAEASLLAGTADPDDRLRRLAAHYATIVVTSGASGARAATHGGVERFTVDAPKLDALDTTGAGDAFAAGFLTGFLRGEGLERCLHHGVTAGSSAVLHFGGRPPQGIPFA
jgi:sugar/nucleoside kinase (ribokinase family)